MAQMRRHEQENHEWHEWTNGTNEEEDTPRVCLHTPPLFLLIRVIRSFVSFVILFLFGQMAVV